MSRSKPHKKSKYKSRKNQQRETSNYKSSRPSMPSRSDKKISPLLVKPSRSSRGKAAGVFFRGMAMGTADVIPGVSGGTVALLLGIYQRLISALKGLSFSRVLDALGKVREPRAFRRACEGLDLYFLLALVMGMGAAIAVASHIVPDMMVRHTALTLALFLGLIFPSITVPWKLIRRRRSQCYVAMFIGVMVTAGLSLWMKTYGSLFDAQQGLVAAMVVLFFSGMLAISAMLLPGISGSFVLMVLGQYFFLMAALKRVLSSARGGSGVEAGAARQDDVLSLMENFSTFEALLMVSAFALGCACGLMVMSRLINFALKRTHDNTMAALTGMVIGSFYVLWPFKRMPSDPEILALGKVKWLPVAENHWPLAWGAQELWSLLAFAVGVAISSVLMRLANQSKGLAPHLSSSIRA